MADKVLNIEARLDANSRKYRKALDRAQRGTKDFGTAAKRATSKADRGWDKAGNEVKQYNRQTKTAARRSKTAARNVGTVGTKAKGLRGAVTGLGSKVAGIGIGLLSISTVTRLYQSWSNEVTALADRGRQQIKDINSSLKQLTQIMPTREKMKEAQKGAAKSSVRGGIPGPQALQQEFTYRSLWSDIDKKKLDALRKLFEALNKVGLPPQEMANILRSTRANVPGAGNLVQIPAQLFAGAGKSPRNVPGIARATRRPGALMETAGWSYPELLGTLGTAALSGQDVKMVGRQLRSTVVQGLKQKARAKETSVEKAEQKVTERQKALQEAKTPEERSMAQRKLKTAKKELTNIKDKYDFITKAGKKLKEGPLPFFEFIDKNREMFTQVFPTESLTQTLFLAKEKNREKMAEVIGDVKRARKTAGTEKGPVMQSLMVAQKTPETRGEQTTKEMEEKLNEAAQERYGMAKTLVVAGSKKLRAEATERGDKAIAQNMFEQWEKKLATGGDPIKILKKDPKLFRAGLEAYFSTLKGIEPVPTTRKPSTFNPPGITPGATPSVPTYKKAPPEAGKEEYWPEEKGETGWLPMGGLGAIKIRATEEGGLQTALSPETVGMLESVNQNTESQNKNTEATNNLNETMKEKSGSGEEGVVEETTAGLGENP